MPKRTRDQEDDASSSSSLKVKSNHHEKKSEREKRRRDEMNKAFAHLANTLYEVDPNIKIENSTVIDPMKKKEFQNKTSNRVDLLKHTITVLKQIQAETQALKQSVLKMSNGIKDTLIENLIDPGSSRALSLDRARALLAYPSLQGAPVPADISNLSSLLNQASSGLNPLQSYLQLDRVVPSTIDMLHLAASNSDLGGLSSHLPSGAALSSGLIPRSSGLTRATVQRLIDSSGQFHNNSFTQSSGRIFDVKGGSTNDTKKRKRNK